MRVIFEKSLARGAVTAPPSKSEAHRLLICAGLSGGPCTIKNLELSQDLSTTLDCLRALGVTAEARENAAFLSGGDPFSSPREPVFCRESGSTLRFFLPIFLLGREKVTLCGAPRLMERPLEPYAALCRERGLLFRREPAESALYLRGPLTPGVYSVPGNISSQFISGLLFALPLLEAGSVVELTPPVVSRPYIELTRAVQRRFGVLSAWTDDNTLRISGGQRYLPADAETEGDWSAAAVLEGLNLLGGQVQIEGLNTESYQGDKIYREHFEFLRQGCPTLDVAQCPDLAPVLMALGAAQNGVTLTGTGRLRLKESDRGEAMARELRKLGAAVTVEQDRITVLGGPLHAPEEPLSGHNDHRVVMALSMLLTRTGGVIEGAQAADKSWPSFFDVLEGLDIRLRRRNDASKIAGSRPDD